MALACVLCSGAVSIDSSALTTHATTAIRMADFEQTHDSTFLVGFLDLIFTIGDMLCQTAP